MSTIVLGQRDALKAQYDNQSYKSLKPLPKAASQLTENEGVAQRSSTTTLSDSLELHWPA